MLWDRELPPLISVIVPPAKSKTFGLEVATKAPVATVTVPVADTELMSIRGDVSVMLLPAVALPVSVAVPAPMSLTCEVDGRCQCNGG